MKTRCLHIKNLSVKQLFVIAFLFIALMPIMVFGQLSSVKLLELSEINVSSVGFNTEASEIGVAYVGNNLMFSAYSDRHIKRAVAGNSEKVFYTLFTIPTNKEGVVIPGSVRKQITDLNSGFHEGPAAFSPKTGELFVTLSNSVNIDVEENGIIVKRQKMRLRIVTFKNENGKWVQHEEMPFNDKVYSVGHPSLTPSGDTLFFTSDLPFVSKGGTDIFMVTRKNGEWSFPTPLSDKINTTGNEMFPFYHPSGLLFFASNNQENRKGGLDLYVSDFTDGNFSSPKPIDALNTPYDDFGLIVNESGQSGYFVSNRPGDKGDDDIYHVTINQVFEDLDGLVLNEYSGEPLSGADIEIFNCDGISIASGKSLDDGVFKIRVRKNDCYAATVRLTGFQTVNEKITANENNQLKLKPDRELNLLVVDYDSKKPVPMAIVKIKGQQLNPDKDGKYVFLPGNEPEIDVSVTSPNYLSQNLKVPMKENKTLKTVYLMKMELNKTFVLDNIYYDLDKWDILASSKVELDKLVAIMLENPSIRVELGSHTDSRGSDQYNMTLSQRRSESAVAYIVSKGVPKSRIVAKGYGETKLINRCKNGVKCSDDEHRVNRRTEFKIIGFVK
jgi:outer membrane protein OmpA-like peptidoglycan-associated protein